jgi:hypothetical protein
MYRSKAFTDMAILGRIALGARVCALNATHFLSSEIDALDWIVFGTGLDLALHENQGRISRNSRESIDP